MRFSFLFLLIKAQKTNHSVSCFVMPCRTCKLLTGCNPAIMA